MNFLNDRQRDLTGCLSAELPDDVQSAIPRAIHIVFPSAHEAEHLLAGLPLVSRVTHAVALGTPDAAISAGVRVGEWIPSGRCIRECNRLSPGVVLQRGRATPGSDSGGERAMVVDAMAVLDSIVQEARATFAGHTDAEQGLALPVGPPFAAALREADRILLKATAKQHDGLVSRYLNRPISQAISRVLLRFEHFRPIHATIGTALLAVLMIAALLGWPAGGAIAGALLYQAASVFDGVDGEIARTTFRTSPAGARLDSLIDAATNLAFFAGLAVNLAWRGETHAALAGGLGMLLLLAGLLQIGLRAHRLGQPINFEAVKVYLRQSPSRRWLVDVLIWLTMRDFIALFVATLAVCGMAVLVPFFFLTCSVLWFAAITIILALTRRQAALPQA